MEKDIQQGRTCTLKLNPESPSAMEFGEEVLGKIMGRDHLKADQGTLNDLYPNANNLTAIVVEDEAGIQWRVPEMDVDKIVCGDEDLCN